MKLPVKTHSIVRNSILALISIAATAAANISLDFVTIGDPGNANDPSTGVFYDPSTGVFLNGSVNYTYYMGKYNVTLSQYTAFLNAVAQSDPYGLYDTSMTDPNIAGIARDGSPGSYSYSVIGSGQRPVTGVGWGDAARFANWLHNGQPMGLGEVAASTEQGAYTLNGITNNRSLLSISRNGNAQYWIPSEKEWYKAAYYDPNKGGSGVGGYWTYATMSDSMPGNVVGGGTNQANYNNGVYSVTQSSSFSSTQNYLTDVGAFSNSASAYGTYDQNGNVWQLNESVIDFSRGLRGGAFHTGPYHPGEYFLQSSTRIDPSQGTTVGVYNNVGFRVVSATVPEPTSVALLLGCGSLPGFRRRRCA